MKTMTTSTTRDRIETVIFTPTTSFDCCGFNDDSLTEYGYCPARERSVSYENMEELKDKLFLMYEEDEQENTYHAHHHQQQQHEQHQCEDELSNGGANNGEEEYREEKEAAENSSSEDDEDDGLIAATANPSPPPLRSILKNKCAAGTYSTSSYHSSSSYPNKTTQPTTPRLPASGSTPSTKRRVRSTPTKKKNRLVRFLISSPGSKTNPLL